MVSTFGDKIVTKPTCICSQVSFCFCFTLLLSQDWTLRLDSLLSIITYFGLCARLSSQLVLCYALGANL